MSMLGSICIQLKEKPDIFYRLTNKRRNIVLIFVVSFNLKSAPEGSD